MLSVEDSVILKYLHICANPLRKNDQLKQEYEELKNNPRVTGIGFYRPDVLMVGTDEIVVECKGPRLIGEFIIFLIRRRIDCYWEVDFRFWNTSCPIYVDDKNEVKYENVAYIHPHIVPTTDKVLDCPNGALCISSGQFGVFQHIRKGEMHLAASKLIGILETYPTEKPYHNADNWPKWRGGENGA